MFRQILTIIGLLSLTITLSAQIDYIDYRWELADIAFSYPATWDEPYAVQRFGVETLVIAESDVQNFERDREIPFIIMTFEPATDTDLDAVLQARLTEFEIEPDITIPAPLMGQEALWAKGASRDDVLFGMGMTTQIGDQILSIVGRSTATQSVQLEYSFDLLSRSLTRGAEFGAIVPFGVVWSNVALSSDNETAFVGLRAITIDETNNALYAVDETLGLLRFDLLSGQLESIIPNVEITAPTSIAISPEQTIYIGDSDCGCIYIYADNQWQEAISGYASDAPQSIVTTTDGTLYATDIEDGNVVIRGYATDGMETIITFDVVLDEQPLLFVAGDTLRLYDAINGEVLEYDGATFVPVTLLETNSSPLQIQMATDGTYIIATNESIDLYTPDSLLIDTIVINDYLAGSVIQGIALGQDSIIYVASLSPDGGAIEALSQRVPEISVGLQTLAPYRISSGYLDQNNPQDIWLIDGIAGEVMSLFVQGYSEMGDFDFSITLIAPDGTEIITLAEDTSPQALSRNIQNYVLPDSGIYKVQINNINSQGRYDVTLVSVKAFTLNPDITILWGSLTESYAQEMWSFEASARTTVTITLAPTIPTQLDPIATLSDARYNRLAQNDDALDTSLGNTAQISQFTLPLTGVYHIDAERLEGGGNYKLTVEIIEPES